MERLGRRGVGGEAGAAVAPCRGGEGKRPSWHNRPSWRRARASRRVDGCAGPAFLRPVRVLFAPSAGAARAAPALLLHGRCACCAPHARVLRVRLPALLAALVACTMLAVCTHACDFFFVFHSNMLILFC